MDLEEVCHRRAMSGIVPKFILENRIKFGFNTPLSIYFSEAESPANKILLSDRCLDRGTMNRRGLQSLIDGHVRKQRDNSALLFRLLCVELWFRHFIDGP